MKRTNTFLRILLLVVYFTYSVRTSAQTAPTVSPSKPANADAGSMTASDGHLFDNDDVLPFTLTCNLRKLLKDRGDTRTEHPVLLTYSDARQDPVALPLTVKTRGNFRRQAQNCPFPPLLLDFPKKKTQKTVFEGQNKLKLVTHCRTEEYVLREYMVYKLYNVLTNASFRARLTKVSYVDSVGKRTPQTYWSFLLEDDDAMAKRNGGTVYKMAQTKMNYTDSLSMATLAIFEYMIGNTDWSVPFLHNIRLISVDKNRPPVPVAYDFDHSGIVDAQYALPAEQLGIQSVRQRLYRGITYSPAIFQKVFDRFNQLKPQFYALYTNETQLNPSYVKKTLKYLDDFYDTINKPSLVRSEFLKGDRTNVVIKGLK